MKKIRGLCLPVILRAVLVSQHIRTVGSPTPKGEPIIPAYTVQNVEVNQSDIEIQNPAQSNGDQKGFTVDMDCPYSPGTMKVTITPNDQTSNSMLVPNTSTASGDGLPIYLHNSNSSDIGNAITLGSRFTPGEITEAAPARKITLYAKLGYKRNMQSLRVGTFFTTATLVVSYS